MIKELEIQHFKCFKNLRTFEFSKLNLITGINGRGKSSLLQSILLFSQSSNFQNQIDKLKFNGEKINLGNYEDVKNSETPRSEPLIFKFSFDNTMKAQFTFVENEDDEFTSIIKSQDIYVNEDYYNELNDAFSSFTERLNDNLEDSNKYNISTENLIFSVVMQKIHYVSADRLGPVKYVDKMSFDNSNFISVGSRGEYSINVLAKDNLPLVDDKLYLGNDSRSVLQQTQEWLGYILDGAVINIEGKHKSSSVLWMLLNNKSNSFKYKPANVGFGYSYILPLIVSGLIAQPGEILIVENPEAHLHPRAQSKMSEFFAKVASTGVQVFIESHSEHILNGLRVSSLRDDINLIHSDLAIHYFNESFGSEKLIMDEKGKIPNWPNGFFDQQEIDLADIFKFSR